MHVTDFCGKIFVHPTQFFGKEYLIFHIAHHDSERSELLYNFISFSNGNRYTDMFTCLNEREFKEKCEVYNIVPLNYDDVVQLNELLNVIITRGRYEVSR